jgi:hypothetical protein
VAERLVVGDCIGSSSSNTRSTLRTRKEASTALTTRAEGTDER